MLVKPWEDLSGGSVLVLTEVTESNVARQRLLKEVTRRSVSGRSGRSEERVKNSHENVQAVNDARANGGWCNFQRWRRIQVKHNTKMI